MLKGCKILTSFCVICAMLYGGAYGAASVRGGATSRAGSIRTFGAGTTASVKTTTARPQPTVATAVDTGNTETAGGARMPVASGLSGSKLPGRISGNTSSSGDSQNVAELRQAIEQLRNDYDALGEQYNNLSSDISNVSDTAQVARDVAANNTNTLTLVRTDLSVAQSDIEDLKANGGLDEEAVQEALNTTLAQRNYATRGELAATDAVARGAVQVADLPQRLNALNIADKDYVASQALGAVNDSLNVTLGNYYTKGQVNDAIGQAKLGMVDKDYVDDQVRGLAPKNYVDAKVAAAIEVGVNEDAVQGIVNNSIGTRLANYYTKGDIDDALVNAVADAKAGMADRDYVNNQVRDVTSYVDEKVAEVETGVDTGTLYNILETRGYKTEPEVQGIVRDSLNETMANYYTGAQVDTAIAKAKAGMVDRNQVDNMIDGLAAQNWVTGQINTVNNRIDALPLGLDRDAVKGVVEEYGYKTEDDVRNIVTGYNYATVADLPDMINQWAPGAELQYADGKLYFVDKDGNDRVVDIRGLDGQDGAQIELRKSDGQIQWRWVSGDDQSWHDLVALSELAGADGKSVDLDVISMSGIKNALVWKKEGETNSDWRFLYNLDDINGVDGCSVRAEKTSTETGTTVTLLKDCPGQQGHGDILVSFDVLNGSKGTVGEEQIIEALESNPTFVQLKNKVNNLEDAQNDTYNLATEVYDAVNNGTTGLVATNTLANKAWSKVEDLEATNKTARVYVDNAIGDLGYSSLYPLTKFASVAAKLGDIGPMQTVAEYINDQVSKVNTSIEVRRDYNGYAYICNTGKCTGDPYPNSPDWTRISVDLTEYLTKDDANELYAKSSLVNAVDNAQQTAELAIEKANQSLGKLDGINTTVKGYVDDYVKSQVGTLGFNIYTGLPYTVEGKLGFTNTAGTVKEYIDSAVRSVNTKIKVERSVIDGKTYICKNGDACTSQAGPYSTDEWVPVSVDMSGYLTQNDADNRYATISALDNVKTTANEAKTTAAAAQQTANSAQTTATAAQSTANDAWSKLFSLEGQTVKEYVEDKLSGISTEAGIQIEQYNGSTYICKKGTGCRTPVNEWRAEYEEINMDGYLTDAEAAGLYAQKSELDSYALKSDIGSMGNFGSVEARIGTVPANQTMVQYIAAQLSNVSTDIQVQTSTVDGFTYICRTGSGCTGEPSQNPSQWAKVNVDLGTLGTNPSSGQAYNVATKIGLIDSANINKTVVGYIGEQIGSLGTYYDSSTYMQKPHSVLTYLQANYVPLTKLGSDITGTNQTVAEYIGGKIGNLGYYTDTSGYPQYYTNVKDYVDRNFALKTTIGDLGSQYTGAPSYTVADKIGLTGTNSSKTVVQYVGEKIGNLGTSYQSVADKLGSEVGSNQTVAQYIAAQLATVNTSIVVKSGTDGNTYICTGNDCTTHVTDPNNDPTNWTKLNVDLSGINAILAGFGGTGNPATVKGYVDSEVGSLGNVATGVAATSVAEKLGSDITGADKTVAVYIGDRIGNLGSYSDGYNTVYYNVASKIGLTGDNAGATVKGYVDNVVNGLATETYVGNKIGNLGDTAANTPATSVAAKLGAYITNADKTVAEYIADYVAANTSSGGVTVKTVSGTTYICTDNCENDPPCQAGDTPATCGWQELDIDLTAYLKSSVAASTYLPQSGLRLVRDGEKIYLKQMNGDTVLHDYGEIANVSEFMCASYRMEKLESGDDGYVAGKESFKLICNTNE